MMVRYWAFSLFSQRARKRKTLDFNHLSLFLYSLFSFLFSLLLSLLFSFAFISLLSYILFLLLLLLSLLSFLTFPERNVSFFFSLKNNLFVRITIRRKFFPATTI